MKLELLGAGGKSSAGKLKEGEVLLQVLCKDPRTLAAGGGVEMEIAQQLGEMARKETGLEQYAIGKFAEALEVRSFPAITSTQGPCFLQSHQLTGTSAAVPSDKNCV